MTGHVEAEEEDTPKGEAVAMTEAEVTGEAAGIRIQREIGTTAVEAQESLVQVNDQNDQVFLESSEDERQREIPNSDAAKADQRLVATIASVAQTEVTIASVEPKSPMRVTAVPTAGPNPDDHELPVMPALRVASERPISEADAQIKPRASEMVLTLSQVPASATELPESRISLR